MTDPVKPDRATAGNIAILDAARAVIAEQGLAGMSLRTVAQQAGLSVGAISYRFGDRAALVAAILEREIAVTTAERADWTARVRGMDPVAAEILPDLVIAWLEAGAWARRTSAIVTCELALLASRDPAALPGMATLFAAGDALWAELLPDDAALARRIASYCRDEQPFSILLSGDVDYRLLRQSTVRGLLRDPGAAVRPAWGEWHMGLVDRLAVPAAAALGHAVVPEGAKAVIAGHAADVIVAQGVGALSHRVVAQASGIAVSSIAHHYPSYRDVLFAGVEAIYRRMRAGIVAGGGTPPSSSAIIRLTHECALHALSNPAFLPFAIDMRRRRAENVHPQIAALLDIPTGSDRARVQAVVMGLIGEGLFNLATGRPAPVLADAMSWMGRTVRVSLDDD
ncbi:TetR family transcriptional regulator [Sphingomonas arantia]|uniref:TetR family transcriptional regulator n=1 Tax=Sphingomonas arantia TaxID=1460676 RepID=A0ABW4TZM4_9SPHN